MADPVLVKTQEFLTALVDIENPTSGPSPIYLDVRSDIELMIRLSTLLPDSGSPLAFKDPDKAVEKLIRMKKINSKQDISDAADRVTAAFNLYFGGAIKAFAAKVGEDTIRAKSLVEIFSVRREDEVAENNLWLKDATDYKGWLEEAATKLSIGLTTPAPKAEKPVRKPGKLFQKLFYEEVPGVVQAGVTFDWQTARIFDPQSPEALQFTEDIYANLQVLEPAALLQALEVSFGMTAGDVKDLLNTLYAQTIAQIEACRKTLAYIEADFKFYQDVMTTGLKLQQTLMEVGEFFGFSVGKPARKSNK